MLIFLFRFVRYNENIITDPGHVDIFPASKIPKKLHHLVSPIYRNLPGSSKGSWGLRDKTKEKGFRLATESSTLQGFLQCAPDAGVTLSNLGFLLVIT